MIRVKICGINSSEAFDTAVEAGADWLGFVFFPASPRFISPQAAAGLSRRITGGPKRVGLFVDPPESLISSALDVVGLDILQVYGTVDTAALKARFGLPVWRPAGIASVDDLPRGPQQADALLIEAKAPKQATRPGGNATTFDWSILQGWAAPAPWILGGGLTPDNVAAAIRTTGAEGVDVSSGVERTKGVKDPTLIRAFIQQAKAGGEPHPA